MNRPAKSAACAIVLVVLVLGCDDSPTRVHERAVPIDHAANPVVLDAANGGSAGFYFLPPTVGATPSFSGTFDGSLASVLSVEICELDAAAACAQAPVVTYAATAADYRNAIRVNAPREFYLVYWNVDAASAGVGRTFRARVLATGILLGYIDIADPVAGTWRAITFRVEDGAIAAATPPPATASITSSADGSRVGGGLQSGLWSFTLETPAPAGGVDVQLTSSDPALLLLSHDGTSPGSPSIVITIPQGGSAGAFRVQGVEGATGDATIAFSATGYAGSATIHVVPVAADIHLLSSTLSASASDVPFHVRIGALDDTGTGLYAQQAIRPGGSPLTFTVSSSNAAVARLVTSAGADAVRTVTIGIGSALSPPDIASGGIALDPLTTGTTTVTLSHPTVTMLPAAALDVTVIDQITVHTGNVRVGAGLQHLAIFTLGAPAPAGGITVRLESSDPDVLLLAPNATTAAAPFVDVTLGGGLFGTGFYIVGADGADGVATITASAPGFTAGSSPVIVTPAAVSIIFLDSNQTAGGPSDPFVVQVGAINQNGTGLYTEQDVRFGGPPIVIDIANSDPSVAQLFTSSGAAQTVSVVIPPGSGRSPPNAALGGVELVPLAPGQTNVSASGSAVVPMPRATIVVNVN